MKSRTTTSSKSRPVARRRTGKTKKRAARKTKIAPIDKNDDWKVRLGRLVPGAGHPGKVPNLFQCIGEKIPFFALKDTGRSLKKHDISTTGVYIAHDSMGCPRYAGRGNIFARLYARRTKQPHELAYFSFYVVKEKKHEREIETLIIRSASFLLEFNDRKRRVGIHPASAYDFEAGTYVVERTGA